MAGALHGGVVATGGDFVHDRIINGKCYRIHFFTTPGSSTLDVTESGNVEYLVVGGGGAGYGAHASLPGGSGGSGIVIIRYLKRPVGCILLIL